MCTLAYFSVNLSLPFSIHLLEHTTTTGKEKVLASVSFLTFIIKKDTHTHTSTSNQRAYAKSTEVVHLVATVTTLYLYFLDYR